MVVIIVVAATGIAEDDPYELITGFTFTTFFEMAKLAK
jgi:hypothetical protein